MKLAQPPRSTCFYHINCRRHTQDTTQESHIALKQCSQANMLRCNGCYSSSGIAIGKTSSLFTKFGVLRLYTVREIECTFVWKEILVSNRLKNFFSVRLRNTVGLREVMSKNKATAKIFFLI